MDAILSAGDIGQETWYSVVTGCGVIVKVDQWSPGESGDLILQFPDKYWVQRTMAWHGAIAGGVYQVIVTDVMKQLPPLHTQYQVEVPFIQMDDSKPVNPGPPWILFQHPIDNRLPPLVGVPEVKCIIQ